MINVTLFINDIFRLNITRFIHLISKFMIVLIDYNKTILDYINVLMEYHNSLGLNPLQCLQVQ